MNITKDEVITVLVGMLGITYEDAEMVGNKQEILDYFKEEISLEEIEECLS